MDRPGALNFAAAAICAALLATHGAAAGQQPSPGKRELSEADRRGIVELFDAFSKAMLAGSVEQSGELLSPDLPGAKRDKIIDDITNELKNYRYEEFRLIYDDQVIATFNDDGTVRLESVQARYRYLSTASKLGAAANEGENTFAFVISRTGGRWYIADSDFFDVTTEWTQANVLSWMFFMVALIAVSLFFWGWMVLDCSLRYRSWKYSVALLLTPPVGALYYFFAVWLRTPTGEIGE